MEEQQQVVTCQLNSAPVVLSVRVPSKAAFSLLVSGLYQTFNAPCL